jgi:hypothetical protein
MMIGEATFRCAVLDAAHFSRNRIDLRVESGDLLCVRELRHIFGDRREALLDDRTRGKACQSLPRAHWQVQSTCRLVAGVIRCDL